MDAVDFQKCVAEEGNRSIIASQKSQWIILHETWLRLWQVYMSWFSWHFGIHVFAIGGTFSIGALTPRISLIGTVMAVFGILGLIGCMMMGHYHNAVLRKAEELVGPESKLIFGGNIAHCAAPATLATNPLRCDCLDCTRDGPHQGLSDRVRMP